MSVAVVGGAMTRFGERDAWLGDLLAEAGADCLADAGASPAAVDHLLVSTSSGAYQHRGDLAGALASDLGLDPDYAASIDQTSASGGAGIYEAWQSIASGESDATLLVGAEKLTHLSTPEATDGLAGITHPVEHKHGITMPAFAGLAARRYLERYDAPREALAEVAVKNHEHGLANPNAHLRKAIDVETVLESPVVADPLRLYDFCPISDGSAALLFCREDLAAEYAEEYAVVAGVDAATDTHVVHERAEPTRLGAVERAADGAYAMADLGSEDVHVAEVHDMFTILEVLQMEALGFAETGRAWERVAAGETRRDGPLPINTSGGLKSKGHPVAASGVAQGVELYEQLTDDAGERQVSADVGLACNVGGFGNCAVTTVLRRGP